MREPRFTERAAEIMRPDTARRRRSPIIRASRPLRRFALVISMGLLALALLTAGAQS